MSLFSVQEFAVSIVNGITSPNWQQPLLAEVVFPIPDLVKLAQPRLFVWGAAVNEQRVTIPRSEEGINPMLVPPGQTVNAGWKRRGYTLQMWLYGVQNNNDPNRESKFPVLIEQVLDAIRSTSVPANLVDSVTGEQSWAMDIGEDFTWEYDVDRTLADQRLIRNLCRFDINLMEMFQF